MNNKTVKIESRNPNTKLRASDIVFKAEPIKKNHLKAINGFKEGKNLILNGCAGTGKTFIALNLSLQSILSSKEYEKVVIVRSIVPVRDIGFLKGDKEEKCSEYEKPYINICAETFGSSGFVYERLKEQGLLEFHSTSFNQGITLHRSLVIVDEAQNMNYLELYNIITRLGEGSRIFISGDFTKQNMLNKNNKDVSGFEKFINVIKFSKKLSNQFCFVDMGVEDIVRSELVKDFIEADFNYVEK